VVFSGIGGILRGRGVHGAGQRSNDEQTFYPLGDFRFRRDLRGISVAPSHDVLLVKMSYWLPM